MNYAQINNVGSYFLHFDYIEDLHVFEKGTKCSCEISIPSAEYRGNGIEVFKIGTPCEVSRWLTYFAQFEGSMDSGFRVNKSKQSLKLKYFKMCECILW